MSIKTFEKRKQILDLCLRVLQAERERINRKKHKYFKSKKSIKRAFNRSEGLI